MPAKRQNAALSAPERADTARNGLARTGPRRDVLMAEVLDTAAALFSARGYGATSLQDIAGEIGLSRTSIYYYFSSKEALLGHLVRGVTERTAEIFAGLQGRSGARHSDRLADAVRQMVLWVNDPHTHFKLVDRTEGEMPVALADELRHTKRRVLQGMVDLIEAGMAAGEFRPTDARIAAFAVLGMCNWTAWWFSASGALTLREVADQLATSALASLRPPHSAGAGQDVKGLIAVIRESLDRIEMQSGRGAPAVAEALPAPVGAGSSALAGPQL